MYAVVLKEMAEVINFMPLHPAFTLLGDDQNQLSSEISLRREAIIALHSWLTNADQWTTKAA